MSAEGEEHKSYSFTVRKKLDVDVWFTTDPSTNKVCAIITTNHLSGKAIRYNVGRWLSNDQWVNEYSITAWLDRMYRQYLSDTITGE